MEYNVYDINNFLSHGVFKFYLGRDVPSANDEVAPIPQFSLFVNFLGEKLQHKKKNLKSNPK